SVEYSALRRGVASTSPEFASRRSSRSEVESVSATASNLPAVTGECASAHLPGRVTAAARPAARLLDSCGDESLHRRDSRVVAGDHHLAAATPRPARQFVEITRDLHGRFSTFGRPLSPRDGGAARAGVVADVDEPLLAVGLYSRDPAGGVGCAVGQPSPHHVNAMAQAV